MSPRYNTEEDTNTSSDECITSIASDRQLRPCVPISYNETILKCLHEKPEIRILSNVSIPLSIDNSSEDTDTEDTDEENEYLIVLIHYKTTYSS